MALTENGSDSFRMTPEYRDAPAQQSADRKLFAGDNSEDLFFSLTADEKKFVRRLTPAVCLLPGK